MERNTSWARAGVRIAVLIALAAGAQACASNEMDFGEGEEAPAGAELRATIGASGGVIEGLEGFRLEIPAGALDADTEIVVRPTVDETPLAQTAERVGPAFSISPVDLVLAAPARVTVPVDAELRAAWDVADSDCRVWQRTAEGWERREQTASSAESVTVELDRLSTLAAGVLRLGRTATCTTGCVPLQRIDDRVCFEGTTMCMRRVGALPHTPLETASLTADGGTVYYLFSRARTRSTSVPSRSTRGVDPRAAGHPHHVLIQRASGAVRSSPGGPHVL